MLLEVNGLEMDPRKPIEMCIYQLQSVFAPSVSMAGNGNGRKSGSLKSMSWVLELEREATRSLRFSRSVSLLKCIARLSVLLEGKRSNEP